MFKEAEKGTWKELGDKLRRCDKGECSLKNVDLVAEKVLENKKFVGVLVSITLVNFFILIICLGNMKYLQTESLDANYMFQAFQNQTCRLTVAKEVIMNRHYFMMVIKNSPFTQELNKG